MSDTTSTTQSQSPSTEPPKANRRWESRIAEDAGNVAMRGAAVGAIQWGIVTAGLGFAGWRFSPLYRSFTIQFKVFLQLAGMITGATVESDRRMREFEYRARVQRRIARQAAQRRELYGDDDD